MAYEIDTAESRVRRDRKDISLLLRIIEQWNAHDNKESIGFDTGLWVGNNHKDPERFTHTVRYRGGEGVEFLRHITELAQRYIALVEARKDGVI